MPARTPCHLIDQFLPSDLRQMLLDHALSSEEDFEPTTVWWDEEQIHVPGSRISWKCRSGLGPVEAEFTSLVEQHLPVVLASLGMAPFAVASFELELIAHRNGSFYEGHTDTLTEEQRALVASDRIISMVYYFHAMPRRFTGGDLLLHALGPVPKARIEAADNRLACFPSFMPHEVLPVATTPEDRFVDARFAVNCWVHRKRS